MIQNVICAFAGSLFTLLLTRVYKYIVDRIDYENRIKYEINTEILSVIEKYPEEYRKIIENNTNHPYEGKPLFKFHLIEYQKHKSFFNKLKKDNIINKYEDNIDRNSGYGEALLTINPSYVTKLAGCEKNKNNLLRFLKLK